MQRDLKTVTPHIADTALHTGLKAFFNPLTLIGIFGPLILVNVFKLVNADFITKAISNGRTLEGNPLSPNAVVGIVDFCIQYYTALIVYVFWFFAWAAPTLMFSVKKHRPINSILTLIVFGSGILLVVWFYLFLNTGAVANAEVLQIYIEHNTAFGEIHWPPRTLLFWTRIVVSMHTFAIRLCKFEPYA